jgi:hypothetical protein
MNTDFSINGVGYASSAPALLTSLESIEAGDISAYLPPGQVRRISKTGRTALAAACRAVVDARFPVPFAEDLAPKVGLYIGTAFGVIDSNFLFMDSICEYGAQLASPTHFSHSVNNAYCGFLSMKLNIQGPSCTVCQFGLSFAGALQAALPALSSRSVDLALVGAVEQAYDGLCALRKDPPAAEGQAGLRKHSCTVFFVISREPDPRYPKISCPVWRHPRPVRPDNGLVGGGFQGERHLYAGHMAEQALDLAAACAAYAAGSGKEAGPFRYTSYARGHKPPALYSVVSLQCP